MAIEKLKRHKSPGIEQIPAELTKEVVGQFSMRSIGILILFEIRRNCQRIGRSRPMHLFIRRVINEFVVIIDAYQFVTYIEHYIQHGAVKVNSLCREYYWGSQVWISTQKVKYWSYILHS
jgi:hypothetical protein